MTGEGEKIEMAPRDIHAPLDRSDPVTVSVVIVDVPEDQIQIFVHRIFDRLTDFDARNDT